MPLKKITLFSVLLTLFSAPSVLAEDTFLGQYLSINAGGTYVSNIYQGAASKTGFQGAAANIFLGDQVNSYFGPEVGFAYYSFGSSGGGVALICLNGKFTIPMNNFSVFGKIGAGFASVITYFQTKITTNDFVPSVGAGVGYGFTKKWKATVEFNGAYFPNVGNANGFMGAFTAGVTHYFTL
ncbi:MAG: outer membrane beta-barrel protein [Gammaproteobacteria bacterium]|nr:outer membrane beta-barrel protein [Gammaproteobacteria bacterium]